MGVIVDFGYAVPTTLDATAMPSLVARRVKSPFAPAYSFPPLSAVDAAPQITNKLCQLVNWTKWSHRVLAQVIGSTHPTIAQALAGNAGALSRSTNQRQRLDDAFAVVSRIYVLANRTPDRTAYALTTPGADGDTATTLLVDGEPAKAYVRAMQTLRPAQSAGMMVGSHPLDVRRASVAVLDED
jgi:hypothetical protein